MCTVCGILLGFVALMLKHKKETPLSLALWFGTKGKERHATRRDDREPNIKRILSFMKKKRVRGPLHVMSLVVRLQLQWNRESRYQLKLQLQHTHYYKNVYYNMQLTESKQCLQIVLRVKLLFSWETFFFFLERFSSVSPSFFEETENLQKRLEKEWKETAKGWQIMLQLQQQDSWGTQQEETEPTKRNQQFCLIWLQFILFVILDSC